MQGLAQQQVKSDSYKEQGAPSGFTHGLGDMVAGAAQIVPRIGEATTSLFGNFPNPVSQLNEVARMGADAYAKKREEDYQGRRKAAGEDGFDYGRVAGNIANPLNYVGGGSGLIATSARGALMGVLQPEDDTSNFAQKKVVDSGVGALSAIGGKVVGDAVAGEVSKRGQQVAQLLKEKVPVTIGQRLGGFANSVEEKLLSVPLLGDVIGSARQRSVDNLNRAAYARALDPVGEKLPKDVPLGRGAVSYIGEKLGEKYDNLLPKLTGKADYAFFDDLGNIKNMVQADDIMNEAEKQTYARILRNTVENKFSQSNGVTGESLKLIESELGQKAAKLQVGDVSQRQLADALLESRAAIRNMLERANPDYAKQLKEINRGYANFKTIQKAATYGDEGVFSPRQLSSAVKSADRSKDKGSFAKGGALMQDLSDAGVGVVASRVPNSGTTDRALLFGLGATGLGGYGQTEAPGSDWAKYASLALAPSLLYTRPGVAATNAIGNAIGYTGQTQVGQSIGRALPYVAPQITKMFEN